VAQIPIDKLVAEVEKGLGSTTEAGARMGKAQEAIDFYAYRGKQHMGDCLTDGAIAPHYKPRPYRCSGLTRQIVNVLTDHLYSPGPSRTWDQPAGQEFLEALYTVNHVDALMQRCDQLGHLGDAAAIQYDADEGIPGKPGTLLVWGPDEFHVWENPDRRAEAMAVVTKDRYDERTRYRLWTPEEMRTFMTEPGGGTSGGRVATQTDAVENTYKCLPFGFFHYDFPVQSFWESGISDHLVESEIAVNDAMSRLSEAVGKQLDIIMVIKNGEPGMRLELKPALILKGPGSYMGSRGIEQSEGQSLELLHRNADIGSALEYLRALLLQILESVGVPQSAVQLDYSDAPSGISIIIRIKPLLDRARKRRMSWSIYETKFARTIQRAAGNHSKRPELVASADAGRMSLGWPLGVFVEATSDWLEAERTKVGMGVKSVIQVTMEMYSVQRPEAIKILEQVVEDQAEVVRINPDLKPPTPEELVAAQQAPGQGPDQQGDE
jgi:hypothetical protein